MAEKKKTQLEIAQEIQEVFLGPATFLASKLGIPKQARVEVSLTHVDRYGSRAQLAFGMLYADLMSRIECAARDGGVDLRGDFDKLGEVGALERRASLFGDCDCAKKLIGEGFSFEFVKIIGGILRVEVPENLEFFGPLIGTTIIKVSDVLEAGGVECVGEVGLELVDTLGESRRQDEELGLAETVTYDTDGGQDRREEEEVAERMEEVGKVIGFIRKVERERAMGGFWRRVRGAGASLKNWILGR